MNSWFVSVNYIFNTLASLLYRLIYFKLGWICSRSSKERINCSRSPRKRYRCFGCWEKSDCKITRRKNCPKNLCFGWPCYDGLCRFNCWRSNYYEKSKVTIWESTHFLLEIKDCSALDDTLWYNYISRQECQSYKLTVEDPVSLEYITRHVAGMKQRYTQSSGRRPFGISCLITGIYHQFPI